ncbi:substrate-binding domain-containing protein [Mycolicibacterium phlei]
MGRHSKPDPEDEEEFGAEHDESLTERFGHFGDAAPGGFGVADTGRHGRLEPEEPDYSDYPDYTDSVDDGYADSGALDGDLDDGNADYADESPGATPPPRVPPRSGPAHSGDWEGGEWTGSHRAITPRPRGVSKGVIVALVAVVVLVGAVIVWKFVGDALSDRTSADAARCVDGEVTVAVVADPNIAPHIESLAGRYNETAAPVGDKCVKVGVRPVDADQVVNGFIGTWPAELGDRPALWIPGSSISTARLEAAAGAETVIDSRSLVTSPVLLAVRPQLKDALAQQNWSTLPALQTNPAALDALNLPGWGSLRLALPVTGDSDATYLAAEAVAAAAAPNRPASDGLFAVNTLVAGQPELPDRTTATAMDALLDAADPAAAPVHAVVTTEQQLFQRAAQLSDAKNSVAGWLPPGPTAMADYPTVLLTGDWLSQEQQAAASEFARFMRKPEQVSELVKAGFRAADAEMPSSDVTDFGPVGEPLSVGDTTMRATLAAALTAPVQAPAVTIMLDQSMPTDEGGNSRLRNVVAALNARLQALPPTSAVGLWTFDGTEGRSEVSLGPLSDPLGGQPRSAALTSTLDEQSASSGGAVSFTTLRLVYTDAMANYREGQKNSVLVITTGPHTDRTLDGDGLQAYLRGAFDQARPVAVNVIDFGEDSDQATWQAVAEITGGRYQNLPSSDSPELTATIAGFLG